MGCPAGVALGAVGRVRRGDGGHTGAPDEIKGCVATCCNATCEAWGTKARVAGGFGKQRPRRRSLRLCGCCCCLWSRRSTMAKDLICLKKRYFLLWVTMISICATNVLPCVAHSPCKRLVQNVLLDYNTTKRTNNHERINALTPPLALAC